MRSIYTWARDTIIENSVLSSSDPLNKFNVSVSLIIHLICISVVIS